MKTINILTLLLVIVLVNQSCRNDSDEFITTPPTIEPEVKVIGSVLGTVIDNSGQAIEGATVTFEDNITFTDENGVFQFVEEGVYETGTFISVSMNGYFDGSRKFYPTRGETSMIIIELIAKEVVAQFHTADKSLVFFENVVLQFEANSIMNQDESSYIGNVNVVAKYLDPTLLSTLDQMPGDLTGIALDQNRVVLTSLAMMVVELLDDSGNLLQVQEGKPVEARIPIPEELLENAPDIIPTWYFDEEAGAWVEEGSAVLVNGMYEASLPHFSFWNCDVPSDFVFLKGSVNNRGIPLQNIGVVVKVNNGGASASSMTNSKGFFCGFVPNGEELTLEIFDRCGTVIYSTTITASEVDITLDPIHLIISSNLATIAGSVTYCSGTPSGETYVSVLQGTLNNILPINADFTFSGNISYCNPDMDIVVRVVDPINVVASESTIFSVSDNIEVGEIVICEDNSQLVDPRDGEKYLIVEINGEIWTAENMRYDTDDGIANGFDAVYDHVPEHYGRLYNYYSAQEACPDGWHVPSGTDYKNLIAFLELSGPAGLALKSTEDWSNFNGNNSSGFNAFPVGIFTQNGGSLDYTGIAASFWSSTVNGSTARGLHLDSDHNDAGTGSNSLHLGFSVRCIKD